MRNAPNLGVARMRGAICMWSLDFAPKLRAPAKFAAFCMLAGSASGLWPLPPCGDRRTPTAGGLGWIPMAEPFRPDHPEFARRQRRRDLLEPSGPGSWTQYT